MENADINNCKKLYMRIPSQVKRRFSEYYGPLERIRNIPRSEFLSKLSSASISVGERGYSYIAGRCMLKSYIEDLESHRKRGTMDYQSTGILITAMESMRMDMQLLHTREAKDLMMIAIEHLGKLKEQDGEPANAEQRDQFKRHFLDLSPIVFSTNREN